MTLYALLAAVGLLVAGGVGALLAGGSRRSALAMGTTGAVLGGALGAAASLRVLLTGEVASARIPWAVPLGELHVGVDPLSGFFLLCVFGLSALSAVYGAGYLGSDPHRRPLGSAVCAFDVLVAAMAAVVLARDGVLFLFAWELMSLASFLLVRFEAEKEEVERASFLYLVASHFGTMFLLGLFTAMATRAGGFDFDRFSSPAAPSPAFAAACFLLALVGFGTKAGLWPLHLWLPEAHPAAPSHVSAVMSGVMIKMGIYGILRVLTLLGPPPPWWGIAMLAIGAVSGIGGVLYALAQHDLKRLLAYHSVENIGIIALGLGLGLLGRAYGHSAMAYLGYAGALLHVANHGLFKGLLFYGAGSVLRSTGTRDVESLGGLSRSLPTTALTFLVGSIAISGLPPLNGFVSEWLITLAALRSSEGLPTAAATCAIAAVPALALIGGLASACFTKAFGIVFLGTPRSREALAAREGGAAMKGPMILAGVLCIAIGLWPRAALLLVSRAAGSLAGSDAAEQAMIGPLSAITGVAMTLLALIALLALVRRALLGRREARIEDTWGCGYVAATSRMQYTASSFAQPVLAPFATLLRSRASAVAPAGYFPASASYEAHVEDLGARTVASAMRGAAGLLSRARFLQLGRIQIYLLYVFLTLIVLLAWWLPW